MMKKRLLKIMKHESSDGFTVLMRGKKLHRYIVAYTDNDSLSRNSLRKQYKKSPFDNVTFGGWTDVRTGTHYVDFGTSTKSLSHAIELGHRFKQKAIRDNVKMKEIRLH